VSGGQATSPLAKVALGAALLATVGVVGFVPVVSGAIAGDQSAGIGWSLSALLLAAGQACVVDGPVAGLNSQQAENADQIVSSAFALSGEDSVVARLALMVAWTESGLRNLGPRPGNDGSLGLFQQRGWGTPQQEMDPAVATGLFVHACWPFRAGADSRHGWPPRRCSAPHLWTEATTKGTGRGRVSFWPGCWRMATSPVRAVRASARGSPVRPRLTVCRSATPYPPTPARPTRR
jgi:hypothetical protein